MQEPPSKRRRAIVVAAMVLALAAGIAWWAPRFVQRTAPDAPHADGHRAIDQPNGSPTAANGNTHAAASLARPAQAGAPLPPPGTPLAKIYVDLKGRADTGDAAAATRLYRDARRCSEVLATLKSEPAVVSAGLGQDTSGWNELKLTQHEQALAILQDQLANAMADKTMCADLTDEQLELAPLTLQAARLGDSGASNCYVEGTIVMMGNLLDHPELLTQYKQNALLVADAAVRQGNWDMVGQLQAAYAQLYSANVLPQLTGPDLVQSYRYAKLRRLGAGARGIRYFDAELRMAAQDLPAADIHAADMWAQDTYQRYFFGKPGNNRVRSGYVCEDPNS